MIFTLIEPPKYYNMRYWTHALSVICDIMNKKAVLSQRWPRNAPMRPTHGCPEIFGSPWLTPIATIPNIFHGLLFRSKLWMFVQNLKSVALPVPEIIGGNLKIWALPEYVHAPFSPKFLMGFYSDWPCKYTRQIWSPYSFTRSWDNRGYPKYLGSPWIRPRSFFSKTFNGLLFGLAL